MIYNINGIMINTVYGKTGDALADAYSIDGIPLINHDVLRVLNYNVGQYYTGAGYPIPTADKSAYSALQTGMFNAIDADVCVMQESPDAFCADGTLADTFLGTWFSYIQTTRGTINYQAHKIATKNTPIANYQSVDFVNAVGNYPGYEKGYITVGGKTICLVNTHLSTTQSFQKAQAREILDAVANEEYFIVCGDFNTVIHALTDTDYTEIIKPFVDAGYNTANCGDFGIFPTYYRTSNPDDDYHPATDQIITSANITIVGVYSDKTKLTDGLNDKIDHLPFYADLIIN